MVREVIVVCYFDFEGLINVEFLDLWFPTCEGFRLGEAGVAQRSCF